MSPSSVPELGAVTSLFPMDSAMRGIVPRLGVWKIQDASSCGMTLTRHGTSCPICSARYSENIESFPPEYKDASFMPGNRPFISNNLLKPCAKFFMELLMQ